TLSEEIKDEHVMELYGLLILLAPEEVWQLRPQLFDEDEMRWGMSVGRFYALQEAFKVLGVDLIYNRDTGFGLFRNREDAWTYLGKPGSPERTFSLPGPRQAAGNDLGTIPLKRGQIIQCLLKNEEQMKNMGLVVDTNLRGVTAVGVSTDGIFKGNRVLNHDMQYVKNKDSSLSIGLVHSSGQLVIKNDGRQPVHLYVGVEVPLKPQGSVTAVFDGSVKMAFRKSADGELTFQREGGSAEVVPVAGWQPYEYERLNIRIANTTRGFRVVNDVPGDPITMTLADEAQADRADSAEKSSGLDWVITRTDAPDFLAMPGSNLSIGFPADVSGDAPKPAAPAVKHIGDGKTIEEDLEILASLLTSEDNIPQVREEILPDSQFIQKLLERMKDVGEDGIVQMMSEQLARFDSPRMKEVIAILTRKVLQHYSQVQRDVHAKRDQVDFYVSGHVRQSERALDYVLRRVESHPQHKVIMFQNLRLGGMTPPMTPELMAFLEKKGFPVMVVEESLLEQDRPMEEIVNDIRADQRFAGAKIILFRFKKPSGSVYAQEDSLEKKLNIIDRLSFSPAGRLPVVMVDPSCQWSIGNALQEVGEKFPYFELLNPSEINYDKFIEGLQPEYYGVDDVDELLPADHYSAAAGELYPVFADKMTERLISDHAFWEALAQPGTAPEPHVRIFYDIGQLSERIKGDIDQNAKHGGWFSALQYLHRTDLGDLLHLWNKINGLDVDEALKQKGRQMLLGQLDLMVDCFLVMDKKFEETRAAITGLLARFSGMGLSEADVKKVIVNGIAANVPENITRDWRDHFAEIVAVLIKKSDADLRALRDQVIDNSGITNPGGIDLTAGRTEGALETRGDGAQMSFNIDPVKLRELENAPGLTPVIFDIHPVTDLRMFLGLREEELAEASG
ncbi:MAG: hypothetical protein HQL18_05380, partial [Candidatus Omnitrophica bacterium]|nr:hypothetical protein [Candidatus Omnitrophota bacterium]